MTRASSSSFDLITTFRSRSTSHTPKSLCARFLSPAFMMRAKERARCQARSERSKLPQDAAMRIRLILLRVAARTAALRKLIYE
jgi:hypothetical protein